MNRSVHQQEHLEETELWSSTGASFCVNVTDSSTVKATFSSGNQDNVLFPQVLGTMQVWISGCL